MSRRRCTAWRYFSIIVESVFTIEVLWFDSTLCSMKIMYKVVGITRANESTLGVEETYEDACEVVDYYEGEFDWVGIIEIPIED